MPRTATRSHGFSPSTGIRSRGSTTSTITAPRSSGSASRSGPGLYEDGALLLDDALDLLAPHTYESDGALWLRTTEFGDDKDRVLRRSNGEPTYFLSDVGHHLWK